jgi:hypothetical protein
MENFFSSSSLLDLLRPLTSLVNGSRHFANVLARFAFCLNGRYINSGLQFGRQLPVGLLEMLYLSLNQLVLLERPIWVIRGA